MCLQLKRGSRGLGVELFFPMLLSAMLFLITPLFGSFSTQLYVKLYVLLLQYMSLQYVATKVGHLVAGAEATPRMCELAILNC